MCSVAVIIPTKNRVEELLRALASVKAQTFPGAEVVIVDDCSSEDVLDRNREIYLKYETIFNKTTRGAAYSRNCGAQRKNSEFIAFLDSDDEWLENHLEMSINSIKSTGADFSISWFYNFRDGKDSLPPFTKINDYNKINFADLLLGIKRFDARTSTMVFKRKVFDELLFDETLRKHQDWDLFLRAVRKFKCVVVEEPTVRLYIDKNRSRMSNFFDFDASLYFFKKHHQYMSFKVKFIFWIKRLYSVFRKKIKTNQS